jgi:putative transposase
MRNARDLGTLHFGKEDQSMKRDRYTEAQIAFALRQAENETPVADVVRKKRISDQTYYRCKRKYAGRIGVPPVRRLKQLEEASARALASRGQEGKRQAGVPALPDA